MSLHLDRAVWGRLHLATTRVQPRPDHDSEVVATWVHGPARQDLVGDRPQDHSGRARRKSQSKKLDIINESSSLSLCHSFHVLVHKISHARL